MRFRWNLLYIGQHSYLQYKFTYIIHKLFEVHGVFIEDQKHSLLKLKQIFTVRLKVSCRRPFHLLQKNGNQFFIYRNNRKHFLWILYMCLVLDLSLVYAILYIWILILNLTSRSSCIDFKMSTYLSNTFHNASIHRNIDSKHIFWNFKRTVKIIKISKDSSWRGSIAAETSYVLQNNYSVPHINVLDKQVQLYLFNVHLYLSVICILDK